MLFNKSGGIFTRTAYTAYSTGYSSFGRANTLCWRLFSTVGAEGEWLWASSARLQAGTRWNKPSSNICCSTQQLRLKDDVHVLYIVSYIMSPNEPTDLRCVYSPVKESVGGASSSCFTCCCCCSDFNQQVTRWLVDTWESSWNDCSVRKTVIEKQNEIQQMIYLSCTAFLSLLLCVSFFLSDAVSYWLAGRVICWLMKGRFWKKKKKNTVQSWVLYCQWVWKYSDAVLVSRKGWVKRRPISVSVRRLVFQTHCVSTLSLPACFILPSAWWVSDSGLNKISSVAPS